MRLYTDNGDKAIELPNKKVILFSSYQHDFYGKVEAVVTENLITLNAYLDDVRRVSVKHRERQFWCAAAMKRAHELEKEVKRLSQLVLQNAFEAACEWYYYDPAEGFDNWCQEYGAAALGVQNDKR